MAFTYDIAQADARSRIRFRLGDTNEAKPLLQDETIDAVLTNNGGDEAKATYLLAQGLIAEHSRKPTSLGAAGVNLGWSNRLEAWEALVKLYEKSVATPAGGTSGFRQLSPSRADGGGEYYGGGRGPLDRDWP